MDEKKTDPESQDPNENLKGNKLTTQKDGLLVLIKALQLAQSRGAFSMEESAMVLQAVELFRGDK